MRPALTLALTLALAFSLTLTCTLGLSLPLGEAELEDEEPLVLDGLDRYQLADRLLPAALAGAGREELLALARSGPELPSGRLGEALLATEVEALLVFARELQPRLAGLEPAPLAFDLAVAGRAGSNRVLETINARVSFAEAEQALEQTYSKLGRPGHRVSLMLRVMILQHLYGLSDPQETCMTMPAHIKVGAQTDDEWQGRALVLRSHRQKLLASNIANADTPRYQAQDFDFSGVYGLSLR